MATIIDLNAHADAILEAAKSPVFIQMHRHCMEDWATEINHRIETAAEAGDEDASKYQTLTHAAIIMGDQLNKLWKWLGAL